MHERVSEQAVEEIPSGTFEENYDYSADKPVKFGPIFILIAAFVLWGSTVLGGAWLVTLVFKLGEHGCRG